MNDLSCVPIFQYQKHLLRFALQFT